MRRLLAIADLTDHSGGRRRSALRRSAGAGCEGASWSCSRILPLRRRADQAPSTASPSLSTSASTPATRSSIAGPPTHLCAAAFLLGLLGQARGCLAQRLCRFGELALELAILEERLGCWLAVVHPAVGAACCRIRRQDVLAQIVILDQPLHVAVALRSPCRLTALPIPSFLPSDHHLCSLFPGQPNSRHEI